MKKDKFNNILNDCLERMLVQDETVEQCLSRYPEMAVELEPLLRTAVSTKKLSAIQPQQEFIAKARQEFHSALQMANVRRAEKRSTFLGWQPRWATVVAAILILVLASSGTVAAASASMPDSLLYSVKLVTEDVRLRLAYSPLDKAELYAQLADERVAEIAYLASKGKAEHLEQTTQRLDATLEKVAMIVEAQGGIGDVLMAPAAQPAPLPEAAPAPAAAPPATDKRSQPPAGPEEAKRAELKKLVADQASSHEATLREVLEKAPEKAKPALEHAIKVSAKGYERALHALDANESIDEGQTAP